MVNKSQTVWFAGVRRALKEVEDALDELERKLAADIQPDPPLKPTPPPPTVTTNGRSRRSRYGYDRKAARRPK